MGTHPIFESDFDCQTFEASDLSSLHEQITIAVGSQETVILSLNGSDPLPSEGALADHGIVNGDLLRIIPTSAMNVDHEVATSSTPRKITNVSDVYKKFGLKLCDSDETGKSFRYECVPSAQILINEQLLGPTKLVTVIISFGDEQFAESVVSTKDDAAILAKIEIAIEKQIQKLRTLADLHPLGGLLSLPDELLTNVLSRLDAKA